MSVVFTFFLQLLIVLVLCVLLAMELFFFKFWFETLVYCNSSFFMLKSCHDYFLIVRQTVWAFTCSLIGVQALHCALKTDMNKKVMMTCFCCAKYLSYMLFLTASFRLLVHTHSNILEWQSCFHFYSSSGLFKVKFQGSVTLHVLVAVFFVVCL